EQFLEPGPVLDRNRGVIACELQVEGLLEEGRLAGEGGVHGGPRYPGPRRDLLDRGLRVALCGEQLRGCPHDPGPGGGGLLTPHRRLVSTGVDFSLHLTRLQVCRIYSKYI